METSLNLQTLILSLNSLSGAIPPEIGNLINLQTLSLNNNSLSGTMPPEIGNLTQLSSLYSFNNNLTGTIPPEIGNLTQLTTLYLYENNLSGTIPPEIGDISNLQSLNLSNNFLSGTVPQELGDFIKLESVFLENNFLSNLPLLESIPNTNSIYIQNNRFGFNSIISNLKDKDDNLREANFIYDPQKLLDTRDTIINRLGNFIEFTVSDDHGDNIYQWFKDGDTIQEATNQSYSISSATDNASGDYWVTITNPAIPSLTLIRDTITLIDEFTGDSLALVALYNSTNGDGWFKSWDLSTKISTLWHGVTINNGRVTGLDLNSNSLNGTISPKIGDLTQLIQLNLSNNSLNGTIPIEIGSFIELTQLNLSSNYLTGIIPTEIETLTGLTTLNLNNNSLEGTIPIEIGSFIELTQLNLSSNYLTGTIPTIATPLNNNSLEGTIPTEITNSTQFILQLS